MKLTNVRQIMTNQTLVFIELNNGHVQKVSKEIISHAINNFENTEVNGLVIADNKSVQLAQEELKTLGLKRLYVLEDNLFDRHNTCIFADVAAKFIQENTPDILLMGATCDGRDLAPRIASKLNAGLTADCTDLKLDENGKLLATRPTYGGKMMATIISKTVPNFATVRQGAFKLKYINTNYETEIISINPELSGMCSLIEILYSEDKPPQEDWTCAEIIVAGGLGLKNKENFDLIYKFSSLLGAKPAASRAAVEQGWAPQSIQVGQTGSSVSPKLYIAFGISGAMQHLVGISNADKVIAINTDKNAPIMKSADSALVGDAAGVLNTLISDIENRSN